METPLPSFVVSPEFRFLVACCKALVGRSPAKWIAEDIGAVNLDRLTFLARRHRVEGMVWSALRGAGIESEDPGLATLASEARTISQQGLRAAAESARLQSNFAAAGIDLLFLKGLSVGQLAYGSAFVKRSWDIDLLVAPGAVTAAADVLGRSGYRCGQPGERADLARWHAASKESVWHGEDGLHHVELHSRLADNRALIPTLGMASPRQSVPVAPGIALPTLATDELFAYLCVHGASSAWFRLKWLADLAGLIGDCDGDAIARLYRISQLLGAGRSAAQALILAQALFGVAVPPALLTELKQSAANRWLAAVALGELGAARAPAERRLGTAMIHLSQLLLKPGLSFAWNELGRQTRAAVANR
jgi:hypothetical protein